MDNSVARAVSAAGHPAVLMPAAALIASPGHMGPAALAVSLACACAVLGYSLYKARRGGLCSFPEGGRAVPSPRRRIRRLVGWVAAGRGGVDPVSAETRKRLRSSVAHIR